jgi:hypothetical protein
MVSDQSDARRRIGKTQQAILDALAATEHGNLTMVGLAKRVGGAYRQILSAVQALEKRGRVFVAREDLALAPAAQCGDLTITSKVRVTGGGMLAKPVRIVWLPESRAHYLSDCLVTSAAKGGSGSPEMVAEYERLTGRQSPTRRAIRRLPYRSRKRYPEFKTTHR